MMAARLARPARRPGLWRSDAKRIGDALQDYGNADLHYDDWIRIGHALKRDLPGSDGLALWAGGRACRRRIIRSSPGASGRRSIRGRSPPARSSISREAAGER